MEEITSGWLIFPFIKDMITVEPMRGRNMVPNPLHATLWATGTQIDEFSSAFAF